MMWHKIAHLINCTFESLAKKAMLSRVRPFKRVTVCDPKLTGSPC